MKLSSYLKWRLKESQQQRAIRTYSETIETQTWHTCNIHVTATCYTDMLQLHVTATCYNYMLQLHVTATCYNCMLQLHVTATSYSYTCNYCCLKILFVKVGGLKTNPTSHWTKTFLPPAAVTRCNCCVSIPLILHKIWSIESVNGDETPKFS